MNIFPFVKMAMLMGLLVFFGFWYLPSMLRIEKTRDDHEAHFNAAQNCYARYKDSDWPRARKCLTDDLDFIANYPDDNDLRWGW